MKTMTRAKRLLDSANSGLGWVFQIYAWACERLYHEFAWSYDLVSGGVSLGQWAQWRAVVWPYVAGTRVLELGSGPGHLLQEGRARGFAMVGLERSPQMLASALDKHRAGGAAATLIQADGRVIPFGDGVFDTVVATFPAGYILDPAALTECRRVLRPGGRMILAGLWVGGGPAWIRLIPVFFGNPDAARRNHLCRLVAAHGFQVDVLDLPAGSFRIGTIIAKRV